MVHLPLGLRSVLGDLATNPEISALGGSLRLQRVALPLLGGDCAGPRGRVSTGRGLRGSREGRLDLEETRMLLLVGSSSEPLKRAGSSVAPGSGRKTTTRFRIPEMNELDLSERGNDF